MSVAAATAVLRLGVLGGAFDPPHLGHLALARSALAELALDELRIVPTGQAWHKARVLVDAHHRLAMAEQMFAGLERVCVDARETLRVGPSYTVDTLLELKAEHPAAQLFLIVGQDQAQALTTWHRWRDIAQIAVICVATRPDSIRAGALFDAQSLGPGVAPRHLAMPPVSLSSTEIRRQAQAGQPLQALVGSAVARYIEHQHLYQTIR